MHEINYYLNTSKQCFFDFAETLSYSIGVKVQVVNNRMVFPTSLAEGKFEFYELEDGLSALIINCTFYEELKLVRDAIKSNDYYILHLNLTTVPVLLHKAGGEIVDIGTDWADAALFSSTGKEVQIIIPKDAPFRLVVLIFHRSWAINRLRRLPIPVKTSHVQDLLRGIPIQYTVNLDLKSMSIGEEMLTTNLPAFITGLYHQGNAMKLIALFTKSIVEEEKNIEKLKFEEVVRISNLKNNIEKNIESFDATVEEVASQSLMSKTKFLALFKAIYGKTFTDVVKEAKMQKAAELLMQGNTVADAGHRVGYSNLGHFAAAFRDLFHTTPKQYQKRVNSEQ